MEHLDPLPFVPDGDDAEEAPLPVDHVGGSREVTQHQATGDPDREADQRRVPRAGEGPEDGAAHQVRHRSTSMGLQHRHQGGQEAQSNQQCDLPARPVRGPAVCFGLDVEEHRQGHEGDWEFRARVE